jgi:hypothetical protein
LPSRQPYLQFSQSSSFLLRFGTLIGQQIDSINSKTQVRGLEAGQYFSEAGRIAHEVSFVTSILKVCDYNREGSEITLYFIDENDFLSASTATPTRFRRVNTSRP